MVQAPTREPSDFGIAHRADPALFMPEKAKRASTPKRFLHMDSFALFEVDFIGGVVGASVITSKAANGYHFKTGQRDWPSRTENVLPCRLL